MRLAPLRQHSAYIHPHGVIHIAGQHVFKTRCVCQGQRYPRRLLQPLISRVLIASLILPTAHADIIADPNAPGQQQPIILETANGLPLVNIQTPSAAGVSHNTYQQFDVARPGAILNNSTQSVATQLGGWVQANPHLATGSARLILNEVNSSHPSQLHGFVEIAGSQAELVIANPAGIQCNGCGFINTPHATLTTGTPVMQGGNLAAYRVGGGNISISGLGMDASQVNYAQVIARAVELNASLWAQHLKIITGLNQVSRAGEIQQSQLPPSTSAAADTRLPAPPRFALDVAALGGMYAGKIFLIGTEAGMGVSNAGHLGASAGELYLSSDGTLHNTGRMQSQGNIQVSTAGNIINSGQMLSQGDSQLSTSADIHNSGSIAAQGNLNLHATGNNSNITNSRQAILAAGIQADGSVSTQGKLSLSASRINAQGQQLSGAEQHYLARHLNLSQSQISSRQLSLAASLGDIDLSDSELYITDTLSASTEHSLNTQRATLQAGQFSFKAAQLNNQAGSLIQTGNSSLIFQFINGLDNKQGRISTQGSLKIQTNTVNNQQGRISANQALEIQATDTVDNSEGQLLANQSLKISASDINNQQGTIGSVLGQVSLNSRTGAFNNMAGYVQAADNLSLDAQGINNQHGNLQGRSLAVHNQGFSLNNTQGSIRSLGTDDSDQLMLETGDLINAAGLIHSEQNLYRTANAIEKAGGISIKLSIGNSSSKSSSSQSIVTSKESQLNAGGNINISASGAEQASDISLQGAKLKAGETVSLKAEDQILLQAAQNSQTQTSQNKSSSNSLGIGFNMGGGRNGFSLEAGASRGTGQANGSEQSWTETTITAGKIAHLDSGGDTTLKGAQIKAPQIIANVGTSGEGNLNIESLQDSSQYQAKQKTTGINASLCIPPFCYGTSSGSISQEKAKANSDYRSVVEQTGIFAGDGGFQINVQGETSLIGAVINASKAAISANKNILQTETLSTSNLQNQMEAEATRDGFGLNSNMLNSKYALAKGTLGNVLNSEKQQVVGAV